MQSIDTEKKTIKDVLRAIIWNSGGFGFYLACKWSLTILVVRLSTGFDDAGYLSLAISVSNIFYWIAAYGVRNYQVSDIKNEHKTDAYISARCLTTLAAQLLCIIFCMAFYGFDKRSVIVIIYMLLMSGEAFSDVLQGVAQRHWRMDIVGTSFFIRGLVLIASFIVLYLYLGLAVALLGSSVMTLVVIYLYDIRKVNKVETIYFKAPWKDMFPLLKKCFPLMLVNISLVLFISLARIILENTYDDIFILGIFSSATVPAAILFAVASFVFIPYINVLSESFGDADYKKFVKQFLLICGIIIVFVILSIIVSVTIGGFLLSVLFGEEIKEYSYLLTEALISSGLMSLLWFLIATLTIIRKLKVIFAGTLVGLICCVASASWMFKTFDMSGANYMQIFGLSVALVILLVAFCVYMQRLRKG